MTAPLPELRAELAEVARRTKSRVREWNHLFPLAEAPFDRVCRFKRDNRSVAWATNSSLFLIDAAVSSSIVFAVGHPDQIVGASQPLEVAGMTAIFRSDNWSPAKWLSESANLDLVTALAVGATEQLLVAQNRASLLFEPRGIDADWARFEDLLSLLAALPPDEPPPGKGEVVDGFRFDPAKVAPELRRLLPLLRKWASGDDEQRSNAIESASDDDLRKLAKAVTPELAAIDALIDSEGEPLSDEALHLGHLAEAALEAQQELETRAGK